MDIKTHQQVPYTTAELQVRLACAKAEYKKRGISSRKAWEKCSGPIDKKGWPARSPNALRVRVKNELGETLSGISRKRASKKKNTEVAKRGEQRTLGSALQTIGLDLNEKIKTIVWQMGEGASITLMDGRVLDLEPRE